MSIKIELWFLAQKFQYHSINMKPPPKKKKASPIYQKTREWVKRHEHMSMWTVGMVVVLPVGAFVGRVYGRHIPRCLALSILLLLAIFFQLRFLLRRENFILVCMVLHEQKRWWDHQHLSTPCCNGVLVSVVYVKRVN